MDPAALKLILDEFNRRFDEMEARLDRRFSPPLATEPQDAPSVASALICSTATASTDEPNLDPPLASANSGAADDSVFVTSCTSNLTGEENVLVATSPAERKHQIQELEKLSLTSPGAAAAEDEADSRPKLLKGAYKYGFVSGFESCSIPKELSEATLSRISELKQEPKRMLDFHLGPDEYVFRAIPFGGYVGSYGLEFALAVETKQVAQLEAECSGFLVVRAELEQLLVAKSAAAGQSELHATTVLATPLDTLLCARLGPVKCVLRDTPLGGYDGSLDDDPKSGVAYFDAPLDRAIDCVGQAPAAAAALRADAVGAAGGGLVGCWLGWWLRGQRRPPVRRLARPATATSLTSPSRALWEDWNDDNHGLSPVFYMAELELCNISTYAELLGLAVSLRLTGNGLAGSVLVRRFYLSDDTGRIFLNKEADATIPESFIFPADEPQGKATSTVVFVPIIDMFRGRNEVRCAILGKAPILATPQLCVHLARAKAVPKARCQFPADSSAYVLAVTPSQLIGHTVSISSRARPNHVVAPGGAGLRSRAQRTKSAQRRRLLRRLVWQPPLRLASYGRCPRRLGHRSRVRRGAGMAPLAAQRVNSSAVNAAVSHMLDAQPARRATRPSTLRSHHLLLHGQAPSQALLLPRLCRVRALRHAAQRFRRLPWGSLLRP
jgi:hypothetical protein